MPPPPEPPDRRANCPANLLSRLRRQLNITFLLLLPVALPGQEAWPEALSRMPLCVPTTCLNRSNCVEVMLNSLQSNQTVKALVFMPGATDELYMFKRARAVLTNHSPTLLDAVVALTNQTLIRATFRAPFLLLHTDEDPLKPVIHVNSQAAADKLRQVQFVAHAVYNDRDWDFVQPILSDTLGVDVHPWRHNYDSWHFYRHSFAGWGLNGWETLEAVSLAGKTGFTIERRFGLDLRRTRVSFESDRRYLATPKLDAFPR